MVVSMHVKFYLGPSVKCNSLHVPGVSATERLGYATRFYVNMRLFFGQGPGPSLDSSGLDFNYYATKCPQAQQIVADQVAFYASQNTPGKVTAALLRLLFHDSFVRVSYWAILSVISCLSWSPFSHTQEQRSDGNNHAVSCDGKSYRWFSSVDELYGDCICLRQLVLIASGPRQWEGIVAIRLVRSKRT
jgi:hypothetical protein